MNYRQLHTLTYRFFLLLTVVPLWSLAGHLGSVKVMLPIEPLMILYLPLLLIVAWIRRKKWQWQPLDVGVLALLTAGVVSIPFAQSPLIAGKAAVVWSAYALLFYGSWRILPLAYRERENLWKAYTYSYGALMVYAVFHLITLGFGYHNSYEMAQPFSQGHTLLVAAGFPAFLRSLHRFTQRSNPVPHFSFLLFFTFFTAISFSRLYWLILPFFVFLYLVYRWRKARWWLIGGAVVALLGGFIALEQIKAERAARKAWEDPNDHKTITAQILSITQWNANDSNLDRLNRWKIGYLMFQDHPVTGVGWNNYFHVFNDYPTQVSFYSDERIGKTENAHNLYLGWLSELGLVGVVGGLLFLITQWLQWWRVRHHRHQFLVVALLLNFLLLGIIEDFQFYEKILPYWMFALGWIVAIADRKRKTT